MRHEDISTTLTYYVGRNAEATADAVWDAFSRTSASNSGLKGEAESSGGVSHAFVMLAAAQRKTREKPCFAAFFALSADRLKLPKTAPKCPFRLSVTTGAHSGAALHRILSNGNRD